MAITFDTTMGNNDYSLRNRLYAVIIRQDQEVVPEKLPNGNPNPDYGKAPPRFVVGSLPESFMIDQQVAWNAPWGGNLLKDGGKLDGVLAVTGNRAIAQVGTMQVWQGSGNELSFTLTFEFRAWSSPEKDVMKPLATLLSMSMPSLTDKGFLKTPGAYIDPAQAEAITTKIIKTTNIAQGDTAALTTKKVIQDAMYGKVSISIGKWCYFDNVVITGVQHTINGQTPYRGRAASYLGNSGPLPASTEEGLPQSATVVVQFKPMFMMTEEDIKNILFTDNGQATIVNYNGEDKVFKTDQPELIDLYDPLAV